MTRTRYGVSPWIDQVSKRRRPDYPRFQGTHDYLAVIVGGGLTGTMTAYAFAAAGVRVALLEADRIGVLGSGRAPGVLHGEASPTYRDIEARHGRKVARAMFEASRRAVLDLATTARRLGVKGGVNVQSALRVLVSPLEDERTLAKEVALRRDAGLEAVWLKGAVAARESGIDSARAAIRLRDWGTAHPYQLVTAFGGAAVKRGAVVFEQSPVRRVRVRRKDVEIHTDKGVLTAGTVIVCTGEPTDLFRSLKRHVRYDERYIVLTDRIPPAVRRRLAARAPLVTDTDSPPHVVRWTEEGHIIVAGADQPRPAPRTKGKLLVQRTGQLMYELSRIYPEISGVMPAYGWDLPMAVTADGVMYAGPHRNYPHHLFAWATAHDPAHAFLASRILLRHYMGEPDRADAHFAFTR
jgi:glycine/D-amino acid oxidase-like deaminating enzyme